jgi:hypothetical protein
MQVAALQDPALPYFEASHCDPTSRATFELSIVTAGEAVVPGDAQAPGRVYREGNSPVLPISDAQRRSTPQSQPQVGNNGLRG